MRGAVSELHRAAFRAEVIKVPQACAGRDVVVSSLYDVVVDVF